jgi:hypothetical protein
MKNKNEVPARATQGRAVDKVAQASSPASLGGVPPPGVNAPPGGTPGQLAGEDACATACHSPWLSPAPGRTPPRLPGVVAPARSAPVVLAVCVLLATVVALVLFCFDPREYHFYPLCFFHRTTGLLCPGCGALRATHQLLHGHLALAFQFNPVLVVSLPFVFWCCARIAVQKARSQPLSLGLRPGWLWLCLAAVLLVSVVRNLPGAPFTLLRP